MAIQIVGKCFQTAPEFLDYLDDIKFGVWRPRFVTGHHTGGPDLKTWYAWQKRKVPVTDVQWMKNLAGYYGSPPPIGPSTGPWSSGPHFFFTPANYCILSPPEKRGVHAASFNGLSWGVEMVGEFDTEKLEGDLRARYVDGFACLHIATGLKVGPFKYATQGMHFHRDDPKTKKTCPGKNVQREPLIKEIEAAILRMTGGEGPAEKIVVGKPAKAVRFGVVINVSTDDTLNVRASASGKAPVVTTLKPNRKVTITGSAKNDKTEWLSIDIPGDDDGWVAARFVAFT